MRERVATIDIGSNTMKLLIAERDEQSGGVAWERIYETARPARLGLGIAERRLRESVMDAALSTLAEFAQACRANRVERLAAVGTSALRDAENRDDFILRARSQGIPLEVISGDEEARLSFLAVRQDPCWQSRDRLLVIDIGGGSTEVIFGGRRAIESRVSLSLGAVRLTEAALHSDPPTIREMAEASRLAADGLEGLRPVGANYTVVGVGGTLTNMARVALGCSVEDISAIHGARLTQFDVESQIERYASGNLDRRKRILGLDPDRADVILGGAIILNQVMQRASAAVVEVSTKGLRWGLLYDRFA